jgi:type 1 fimbriae regulatory protein FimB/type 1 fimbriae regulatory protein FimE
MKRPREYLKEPEVERLMDAAGKNRQGHRDATAILLAYRHGLRASELVALRWDDIDLTTERLLVRRPQGGETAVHPIGGKEMRALRRLQRQADTKSVFVFNSERGAPLGVAGYQRMVARAGKAAKFPSLIHSHMLRHSTGYKLANDGHDTRAIQRYLGHRSIVSTQRYTTLAPDRMNDAATPAMTSLSIPDWFPPALTETARQLHSAAVKSNSMDYVALVTRLITDPRMKTVWAELLKRRRGDQYRSTAKFWHAVSDDVTPEIQYGQMKFIFKEAVEIGRKFLPSFIRPQMKSAHYRQQVRRIIRDLHYLGRFASTNNTNRRLLRALDDAAEAYQKLGASGIAFDRERFEENEIVALDYTVNIARIVRNHFGSPLFGTVATISSVALSRSISRSKVHDWCRGQLGQL